MSKIGCEKCDYTGFSFGKIPCVCTEKKPPADLDSAGDTDLDITKVRAFVNGIPVDYDIDTQFKPDPPGDIYGCSSQKREIVIGDPIMVNDIFVGRALGSVDKDGYLDIAMAGGIYASTVRVNVNDCQVIVGEGFSPGYFSFPAGTVILDEEESNDYCDCDGCTGVNDE